ncbi:hypothetical protein G8S49_11050 [Clostridium botulinum C]|uniref:DUF2577 domain-containing protein n=2 Tax=Clostridium botulinum TaxID=1491 RepID=A0A9Q4TM02_CLOBO|nr:hypothetical protein [Clostridium botulinum]EGO86273.1 hypothetical protein CBCST_22790 [Clostridium botulinum C str. Stockholm]MCD3195689.1 hypothetical protein [Clostridium botulinum C]MCD3201105.1 hypothetical protein [Clostridium botulinum C]MCD3206643.1 hypothetical protein [Clostridium botulinum C]MCD3209358.1 hypothetical protein [Clostridium botulinum C]
MTIFNELAREIKGGTNKAIGNDLSSLGFGTITSSGLKLDKFKYEIKDYMILDYLNLKDEYTTEAAGTYTHSHILKTPNNLKALKEGDRVLVTTVGNEFIVVGRVINA